MSPLDSNTGAEGIYRGGAEHAERFSKEVSDSAISAARWFSVLGENKKGIRLADERK